jgi:hypothetical protein
VIHNEWKPAGNESAHALPEPLRALVPYLTIGVLAMLLGAAGAIRTLDWQALVAASAVAGAAAQGWTWIRREHLRVAADAWIGHHAGAVPAAGVLSERMQTLMGAKHRAMVAGGLRRVVSDAGRPYRYSARVPVDAVAVRRCEPQLLRLAELLADPRGPVTPRVVVLAEQLLTDTGSPVYRHTTPLGGSLDERLRQTLFELERTL